MADEMRWYAVALFLGVEAHNRCIQAFYHAYSRAEALGIMIEAHVNAEPITIRGYCAVEVPVDVMKPSVFVSELAMKNLVRWDILENRRITAIKKVREMTKWGLKEAKEWVDKNFPPVPDHGQENEPY